VGAGDVPIEEVEDVFANGTKVWSLSDSVESEKGKNCSVFPVDRSPLTEMSGKDKSKEYTKNIHVRI
jgi:hypothetical protein